MHLIRAKNAEQKSHCRTCAAGNSACIIPLLLTSGSRNDRNVPGEADILSVTSSIRGAKSMDDLPEFLRTLIETCDRPSGSGRNSCANECSDMKNAGMIGR